MKTFPHGGDVRGLAESLGCYPSQIVDFSASINPLGPPEWLRTVISGAVDELVHYPDPHCRELIAAAAERHGVPGKTLLAGNGTSELLFALAQACGLGRAVIPVPSYCDYQTACVRAGMDVAVLPLTEHEGFALDPEALSNQLSRQGGPAAVFVARPNNPTGRDVPAALVRGLAKAHPHCLFVVDEAFGSFVQGFETLTLDRPDNVAVLLSLTKMFAIPGLRLGLACAGGGAHRGNAPAHRALVGQHPGPGRRCQGYGGCTLRGPFPGSDHPLARRTGRWPGLPSGDHGFSRRRQLPAVPGGRSFPFSKALETPRCSIPEGRASQKASRHKGLFQFLEP